MTTTVSPWLTTGQVAQAAGVTREAITKAARRGEFRGQSIVVRQEGSGRGRGGVAYMMRLDSLPADVRARAIELWPELVAAPQAASGGRRIKRRGRGPDRTPRVRVGREWDNNIDLPLESQWAVAAELHQKVSNLWSSAAGSAGWVKIQTFASLDLYELSRKAGSALPEPKLRALCKVPRRFVTAWERRKHRKTHTFLHDAKAFNDAMPSIRRTPPERPLECIVGDGTALDINVLRPDGGQWKIWLILWLDWATGRLFGHPYARPKGGGVRQHHITYSFAILTSEIGMPEAVYLDRGGEYNALRALEDYDLCGVIRSLPYRGPSKVIEPGIGVLTRQHLALIPGFMGGDRLKPLIETVGKPTEAYPNSIHALFADIRRAIDASNATPRDTLGGRSPNEVWNAAVEAGWRPTKADLATVTEALARRETRKVGQGAITIRNQEYTSDELVERYDLEGERVAVHIPIDPELNFPPAVYDPAGAFVGLVYPKAARGWRDPDGAKESARIRSLRRRGARALADAAPPADLEPLQQKFLELYAPPEDPPADNMLELSGERGRAAEARRRSATSGDSLPPPADEPELDWFEMKDELDRKRRAQ